MHELERLAREALAQHDYEVLRYAMLGTQYQLADVVRRALAELDALRAESSQRDAESSLVCCDVCERALVSTFPALSSEGKEPEHDRER